MLGCSTITLGFSWIIGWTLSIACLMLSKTKHQPNDVYGLFIIIVEWQRYMSIQLTFHSQVFCSKFRFSFPVGKLSLIYIYVFGLTESSLSQLRSHKLEIWLFVCLFMDMVAWLDLCLSINNCFEKAKLACLHNSSNVRYFFFPPSIFIETKKCAKTYSPIIPSDD